MISGLVIHLSADEVATDHATEEMKTRLGLELGDRIDLRLPLVVESTATSTVAETTEWLQDLPGVLHIDVTFVHLEE